MELLKRKNISGSMDLVQIEAKQHPGRRVIFELLLCAALSVGCWYTFFSMFPNPVGKGISLLLIAGFPCLLYGLCRNRFFSRFLTFYVFIFTAVFFVMAYGSVWNGLLVMGNIIVEVLNDQLHAGLITFQLSGSSTDWAGDVLTAMVPIMLLVSMGIVHSVFHKEPILGFVLTAIPVMIGLCLKVEPSIWLLLLLVLCWAALLVLSVVAKPESRKKNRPISIQNGEFSSLPFIFLGISIVILAGYVLIFSGEDYKPAESVDEAKGQIIATVEHLRYDNIGGDDIDGLSCGDLTKTHPIAYNDHVALELKMERPQSMYLRGFVGSYFENGKWSETMEGAYSGEYTGIMEWLAQRNFYPWMQQDQLYRMSESYDYVSVDVENVNASSKYMYFPYEAAMSGDLMPDKIRYEKDYAAYAKGVRGDRDYTFEAFLARFNDYDESSVAKWIRELRKSEDWDQYAESEAVYRRYVYDHYLYIPEEGYEALEGSGIEKYQGKTIASTLYFIRKNFDENFLYDIEQAAAPKGEQELDYFLKNSNTGNDMHFATAATLMFRRAGIPARYAEGYYLSPKDMLLYTEMSSVSVSVMDSQAHAWVEIYIDEIGWFPVEVIPGYYELDQKLTAESEEQEELKEDTQKNYEDEVPRYDEPEQGSEEEQDSFSPLLVIALILILVIAMFEGIGRYRIKKLRESFGTVMTDQQVYVIYSYISKVMAFDKHEIAPDPNEKIQEIAETYDAVMPIAFEEYLRIVHKLRFGKISPTEEEHKKMASYAICIGNHVYNVQKKGKKFLMKFIYFYV